MSNDAPSLMNDFAMALDRCLFARTVGIEPDEKQADLLNSTALRILMLCTRQWGKSTIAAVMAAHELIYSPGSTVIAVSLVPAATSLKLANCRDMICRKYVFFAAYLLRLH